MVLDEKLIQTIAEPLLMKISEGIMYINKLYNAVNINKLMMEEIRESLMSGAQSIDDERVSINKKHLNHLLDVMSKLDNFNFKSMKCIPNEIKGDPINPSLLEAVKELSDDELNRAIRFFLSNGEEKVSFFCSTPVPLDCSYKVKTFDVPISLILEEKISRRLKRGLIKDRRNYKSMYQSKFDVHEKLENKHLTGLFTSSPPPPASPNPITTTHG